MTSPNAAMRRSSVGTPETWQRDAWAYYDMIGELRFGVNWISNALSRVNLVAAAPPFGPGDEPAMISPDDEEVTGIQVRAAEIVATIASGSAGQGQMLGAFGTHLSVAGIGWLVVEPETDDPDDDLYATWNVYSSDEIRTGQQAQIEIRVGERDWRPLHPNGLVVKVWRKHPRANWQPDAPTRGVLNVLNEIDLLTKHIQASAQSRLAGAGVLAIPAEATFPPGQSPQGSQNVDPDDENVNGPEDEFVDTLIEAMTVPLSDRSSAASVVPLVVKVPGELVDKIKHLSFSTPFDDRVSELLEGAIKRLALGMDIPPEILTGTSGMNHWGSWQVAEEAITLHVEPLAETVAHALTIGYLRPALEAEGYDPADIAEVMVWYDTSDLRTRPDRSSSAVEAYDRMELSAEAMIRELGLSVDDMPDEEERRERMLVKFATTLPSLLPIILDELGILRESPQIIDMDEVEPAEPEALPEAPDTQGPPERASDTTVISAALSAACDMLVRRALERAGNRLKSAVGKVTPGGPQAITIDDPACLYLDLDATAHADLGSLLAGAWTMVPEIADRYDIDSEALTETLDTYTRALIAGQQEHRYGRLAVALGS
jgi:hypothetical protein